MMKWEAVGWTENGGHSHFSGPEFLKSRVDEIVVFPFPSPKADFSRRKILDIQLQRRSGKPHVWRIFREH